MYLMIKLYITHFYTECPAGSYGSGCLQNCTCVPEQESSPCDHIDGTCHCLPGYNGSNCELGSPTHKATCHVKVSTNLNCVYRVF